MGLMTGRATYLRFKVVGRTQRFDEEHIQRLESRAAGKSRIASADGVDVGWTAGEHALDTDFTLEKNRVNDALTFGFRVDTDKPPSDLIQAYTAIELKALSADNPSGFASSKQKREAKEAARERIEEEAKDGRFRKRTIIPILWDSQKGEILYGSTSLTNIGRFSNHFQQTFGINLEAITAGRRAYQIAELGELTKALDNAAPSVDVAWIADESSRDWMGNEFLLWLWYFLEKVEDCIPLPDKSEVAVMMARTLVVDCPRGSTGVDGFRTEGPTRLPEAKRAIQAGKLPRKAGLTMVRHDQQYEFTLHAETFGIGAAKMPTMGDDITDARARIEERVTQLRNFNETIELLYAALVAIRLSKEWVTTSANMKRWLELKSEAKAA